MFCSKKKGKCVICDIVHAIGWTAISVRGEGSSSDVLFKIRGNNLVRTKITIIIL